MTVAVDVERGRLAGGVSGWVGWTRRSVMRDRSGEVGEAYSLRGVEDA